VDANEIKSLGIAIQRDKILQARQRSPGEKFLDALQLFDFACSWTVAGIRSQFPDADDAEVKRILEERLNWQRRREEPKWKPGTTLLP
jgi:hypothetical protein